jgi:MFS transporter, CP family, cyanate transporter
VHSSRSLPLSLALLWLIGTALRMAILAVPPVIPLLRTELNLSGTEVGILTGLPVILFAVAALVGSRLVAGIGAVAAVAVGLLLTALGSALRAVGSDAMLLFAATALMGVGVAVTQPAAPALVGRWLPDRVVLGTGVYTNGLLVGEILPIALFPLLFPMLGESWRATFVFWAVPIAAIGVLVMGLAPRGTTEKIATPSRWWPDWRLRDILSLGLIFGTANALYFATNAFLPGRLIEAGRPDLVNPALTALNLGQLPASFILIAFARHLERRIWPFAVAGLAALFCIALIVTTAGAVTVAAAAVFGFVIGAAFALCLTLPPLLCAPGEIARVSAAMFTISYSGAMIVSLLSGFAWDATGVERFAFLPIALMALPLILLPPTINFRRRSGADS